MVLQWCAICIHQMALTWSSILSAPSKTIFWKCSCLSWTREPVKYKCSGICSRMYAHNNHSVQFLPCGVTLLRLKCWCSSLFSFTELTLGGSDVMQQRTTLPALHSTAHLPCLGRKGRVWWQWQNIFFITDQENATWSDYGEEFHFMYGFLFSNGYSIDWGFLTQQEKDKIFRMRKSIWLGRVGNKRLFFPHLLRHLQKSSKHCFITKYRRHETSKYSKHNVQEAEQSSENRLISGWIANCI